MESDWPGEKYCIELDYVVLKFVDMNNDRLRHRLLTSFVGDWDDHLGVKHRSESSVRGLLLLLAGRSPSVEDANVQCPGGLALPLQSEEREAERTDNGR